MASHKRIWEVCLGMLKSWLESSKYLIVCPGLQRQDFFPEEHHTAILLSTVSEIAALMPGDYVNLILQRYGAGEGHLWERSHTETEQAVSI